jgi:hypothetical protein
MVNSSLLFVLLSMHRVLEIAEVDAKDGFIEFGDALVFNEMLPLRQLDFSGNPIRSQGSGLAYAFSQIAMPLRKIDLRNCSMPAKVMNQLVSALSNNSAFCSNVIDLDLSGNDLSLSVSTNAFHALLGNISQMSMLEALGLANTSIRYETNLLCL